MTRLCVNVTTFVGAFTYLFHMYTTVYMYFFNLLRVSDGIND